MLKFSYVGMESKTVKVGKENELNVKLSSSLTELDEVVVVGYGTQKEYLKFIDSFAGNCAGIVGCTIVGSAGSR